jgi:hypothetical protein
MTPTRREVVDESRVANLRATLGFLRVPPTEPELVALHRCFDTWSGIGMIAVGMSRQGWDLQLAQHSHVGGAIKGEVWVARYVTGMGHVIEGGAATGASPWEAVQKAAWKAVK